MFAVCVSEFRHLAEFSKLIDVENEAKFRTFAPPSSKN